MFKIFNLEGLFLSKAKKIISALLAVAMLMTAAPVSMFASAYDPSYEYVEPTVIPQEYYVDTSATSDVIRVADSGNPFTLGNSIVMATKSGIPSCTGNFMEAAYADETAAYPEIVIKFVGLDPTTVSTPKASGGITSYTINSTYTKTTETVDGKTAYVYKWLLTGGQGTTGQSVTYTIDYTIGEETYTAYAYAKVEDVLIQTGYIKMQAETGDGGYSSWVVTLQGKNVYSMGFCSGSGSLPKGFINFKSGTMSGGALLGCGNEDELSGEGGAFGATVDGLVDGGTKRATIVKARDSHNNASNEVARAQLYGRDANRPLAYQYIDLRNEDIASLNLREMIMVAETGHFKNGGLSSYRVRLYDETNGAVGKYETKENGSSGPSSSYWNTGTQPSTTYFNVADWGVFASSPESRLDALGEYGIVKFGGKPALTTSRDTYDYAFSNYHYANGEDGVVKGEAGIAITFKVYNTLDLYTVYTKIFRGAGDSYTTQYMNYISGTTYSNQTVKFDKGVNPRPEMYTEASWNAFLPKLHQAGQLLQNPQTDQTTVNRVTSELISAYNGLVKNFHETYTVNIYHYITDTTTEVAPPQVYNNVPFGTKAEIYPLTNLTAHTARMPEGDTVTVEGANQTYEYAFYYDAQTFPIEIDTNSYDADGNIIKKIVNYAYGSEVSTTDFDAYLGSKPNYTFEGDMNPNVTGWYYDRAFTQPVPEEFTIANSGLNVYAKWETTPLHIYLDTQIAGKAPLDLGSVQPYDDEITPVAFARPSSDPQVEGYLFVEYYADPALTQIATWPQTFLLGDTDRTLYGRFADVNGKIVFESNGGSPIDDMPFTVGSTVSAPADPVREGYTFDGWFDSDGEPIQWGQEMTSNTGFIAYAKWTAERHTISFNLNNAKPTEFDTKNILEISGISDSPIDPMDIPNPPRRFGYEFSHWVYEGKQYNFKTYPTKDIQLVAVWRAVDTSAFVGLKAYEKLSGSYGDPITTAQKGDIVTVQMTSLANFYTGSSLFVFMYDKNFFELVNDGAAAFNLNSENEYVSGIDATFTAVTNSDSLRWPAGADKDNYNAIQIAIDPTVTVDNYTTAPMKDGKWLVEFKLKVKDNATGTGKVYMDNVWTRSSSNIMGTMFYGWSDEEVPVFNTTNDKVTPDLENAIVNISLDPTPAVETTVNLNANAENAEEGGKFEATGLSTATFTGRAETEIVDNPATVGNEAYVAPVRTGYTLTGWTNADSTSDYTEWAEGYYAKEGYSADLTFNAVWTPIEYTVTFYSNQTDGVVVPNGSVPTNYDAQIVPPADPVMEGYTFDNWVDKDGNIVEEFPVCKGNADYFATWVPSTDTEYKVVTHYTYGNTGVENYPSITLKGTTGAKVVLVDTATMPANPEEGVTYINVEDIPSMSGVNVNISRGNFVFDKSDARNALPKEATIAADGSMTLDVFYIGKDVTVTFNAGGGSFTVTGSDGMVSYPATITQVGCFRDSLKAPAEPLTRYGYTFNSWTPSLSANAFYSSDTTYTANWDAVSTNVQFKTFDGSEQIGELVATNFGAVPVAPTAPQRLGYDFVGWATTPNATSGSATLPAVSHINDETTGIAEIYYAYYELTEVEVTYKVNGIVKYTDTYTMGETVEIRPAEAQKGYNFSGWMINGAPAQNFVMDGNAVTIEATLTAKEIGIVFNGNGGYFDDDTSKLETTVVSIYDQIIELPEEPKMAGYNFNGWATEATATEGEFDLGVLTEESATYYATWTPKTNVQYYVDIYVMNPDGSYPDDPNETVSAGLTGTVGQPVDAYVPDEKVGFTVDADSVLTGTIPADRELRLVVKYQRNQHSLKTNIDGTVTEAGKFFYEQTIVLPEEPKKDGYTFGGWTWSPAQSTTMPNEDVTLTATWNAIEYTIAFNTDGGSAISSYNQAYETVIAKPTAPTKAGHEFLYWVVEGSTEEVVFSETTPTVPLNGVTFKAIYKTNKYNIVYMDGSDVIDTISVPFGTTKADIQASYVPAETPKADGKTFTDWNWNTLGDTMPANEVRIYASWQNKTYKITFNEMGGTAVNDITAEFGTSIGMYDVTELEGYEFKYWYYDDENTEYVIPDSMPALDSDALYGEGTTEIELKAKWAVKSYTITFNENGGNEVEDITADYNAPITIPTPDRTGYTFDYWYYDDASTEYEIGSTMPALDLVESDGSIELKAHWTVKSVTITFNANGGDAVAPIVQNYNSYISTKPVANRTGHTFKGWLLNGQAYTIPERMPADDITLVADWEVNTYTITFNENGGNDVADIIADFGTDITAKIPADSNMVRAGYTFNGWLKDGVKYDIPAEMPAENFTLVADWKANTDTPYSIKIYLMNTEREYVEAVEEATTGKGTTDLQATFNAPETREGFTLNAGKSKLSGTVTADGKLVLEAYYDRNSYAVTFTNEYDAAYAGNTAGTYLYDSIVAAPSNIPVREGYDFTGWTATVNGATITLATDGSANVPAAAVNFVATWTEHVYTITYVSDGDQATVPGVDNVAFGTATAKPSVIPTKTGYTFDYWYETAGTEFTFGEAMPARNITLTAAWKANDVKVTYVFGGDVPADAKYPVANKTDAHIDDIIDLTKPADVYGFTFGEWVVEGAEKNAEGNYVVDTRDVTVTGTWTRNRYTITFATPEGATKVDDINEPYMTEIAAPAVPTLEGNTFSHWANAAGEEVKFPVVLTADMNLEAKWTTNTYTITYVTPADATQVAKADVKYGDKTSAPADPVRTGYTFAGWYEDGAADKFVFGNKMPASNITLTAKWTANDVKVSYVFTGNVPADAKYPVANKDNAHIGDVILLTKPADVAGYTFGEWTVTGADKNENGEYVVDTREVVVTGNWTINSYTIKFADYDGRVLSEGKLVYDTAIQINPADPVRDGHTFTGWYATIDGAEVKFGAETKVPAADVTFTAKYDVNNYNLKFTVEGAEVYNQNIAYGTPIDGSIIPEVADKDGFTFMGWAVEGTETVVNVPATMPSSALSYVAIFETLTSNVYYYVKVIDGDDTTTDSYVFVAANSLEYGATITGKSTYESPAEGYEFSGWYKDEALAQPLTAEDKVGTRTVKLYATETALKFDALFDANGGKFADGTDKMTVKATYDQGIVAPEAPEREGYQFTGWTPVVGVMDTTGKTFTANWAPLFDHFTITYKYNGIGDLKDEIFYVSVDELFESPADPYVPGYEFEGWAPADIENPTAEDVVVLPEFMPAENLEYVAVFTAVSANATFYKFNDTDRGPAYETETIGYTVHSQAPYIFGETIAMPEVPALMNTAGESIDAYYTFLYWIDDNGNTYEADAVIEMPTTAINFYPVYDRVSVKLVPVEGSTTMIDRYVNRASVVESYNDGYTVTDDDYSDETRDFEQYYIYGLSDRMAQSRLGSYIKVQGDGDYKVVPSEISGRFGTGAKIEVYDNFDPTAPVEVFYIIIFGDVNGDGRVTVNDSKDLADEIASPTWSRRNAVPYRCKAVNLNGDSRITINDLGLLQDVIAGTTLDQKTGILK